MNPYEPPDQLDDAQADTEQPIRRADKRFTVGFLVGFVGLLFMGAAEVHWFAIGAVLIAAGVSVANS